MPLRPRSSTSIKASVENRGQASFLRTWLRDPLKVGAVFPSSKALARAMAEQVPDRIDPEAVVVELGPGTGVMTRALIERGLPEERLVLLEYSPDFCALLAERFPQATIVRGDAYQPGDDFAKALSGRPIAAVVSSLPLMARGEVEREAALRNHLSRMPVGAPFIQFTYSPTLPVRAERIGARVETTPWVKLNLPPARVLVYRRDTPHLACRQPTL